MIYKDDLHFLYSKSSVCVAEDGIFKKYKNRPDAAPSFKYKK